MVDGFLPEFINFLEVQIIAENKERSEEGLPRMSKLELVLLDQISLFVREEIAKTLPLLATADLDAWVNDGWESKRIFKSALERFGLQYDVLSREIWMPKDSTRKTLYESDLIKVEAFSVFDVLISKALKAPGKNRYLIQHALLEFGAELEVRFRAHGIKPEDFIDE